MKKFIYTSVTPCHIEIEGKEFSLYQNEVYTLPGDNGKVKRLVALKHLQEQETQEQPQVHTPEQQTETKNISNKTQKNK